MADNNKKPSLDELIRLLNFIPLQSVTPVSSGNSAPESDSDAGRNSPSTGAHSESEIQNSVTESPEVRARARTISVTCAKGDKSRYVREPPSLRPERFGYSPRTYQQGNHSNQSKGLSEGVKPVSVKKGRESPAGKAKEEKSKSASNGHKKLKRAVPVLGVCVTLPETKKGAQSVQITGKKSKGVKTNAGQNSKCSQGRQSKQNISKVSQGLQHSESGSSISLQEQKLNTNRAQVSRKNTKNNSHGIQHRNSFSSPSYKEIHKPVNGKLVKTRDRSISDSEVSLTNIIIPAPEPFCGSSDSEVWIDISPNLDYNHVDKCPPVVPYSTESRSRRDKYKRLRSRGSREQVYPHGDYIRGIDPALSVSYYHPYSSSGRSTPARRRSSSEDVNGGYSSEPDSFWDVASSASHEGHKPRSKSVQKPSSDAGRKNMVRRNLPRRHTVGGVNMEDEPVENGNGQETVRKREQFMDLLAKRYPRYAEKISSTASEDGFPVRGRRPRDPQRRATVVTYNPGSIRDYEDAETMSNIEGPVSFSRGGVLRSSMPIVRSPPNTYERPAGSAFMTYREETRRSLLPNEITHLDTVRAMFVRAFPEKLNMEKMESPKRKIYILEPRSSIFYQLEDLRDIKDRSVLKIHECESLEPQKVKDLPPETRGKMIMGSQDLTPHRMPLYAGDSAAMPDQVRKAQTLPASMMHSYPPFAETDFDRPRSQTPDPTRSRAPAPSVHSGIYGRVVYQSPDRTMSVSSDRPNLRPIPENQLIQNGYVPSNLYETLDGRPQQQYIQGQGQQVPQGHHHGHHRAMSPPAQRTQPPQGDPSLRRAFSPPPTSTISQGEYDQFRAPGGPAPGAPPTSYVAHGVRASTVVSPLRATTLPSDSRQAVPASNRHSLAFTPQTNHVGNGLPQRSQSYRITPERERAPALVNQRPRSVTPQPVPPDVETKFRMDKMEAQIANLAAWVQSAVVSTDSSRASSIKSGASTTPSETGGSQVGSMTRDENEGLCNQGLSDVSTLSQQTVTPGIKEGILNIRRQTIELKTDLRSIRRMHQLNNESMQESMQDTLNKITNVLSTVPGGEHLLLRKQRSNSDDKVQGYIEDKNQAFKELEDLEASVEEVRYDVLSRHCLVNMSDVEGMALLLSYVAKCFGDLKTSFPNLQEDLKTVLAGEMEVVVKEEKFLKEEPEKLEDGLKRCKKLTNTLFTLKRLASVQEHRPLQVPGENIGGRIPSEHDRSVLLHNIKALIPDHETRLRHLEAADASRERKKKIVLKQDALKFGKTIEIATRSLKPAVSKETTPVTSAGSCTVTSACATISTSSVTTDASKQFLPQTATTKAMSSEGQSDHKSVIQSDGKTTKQSKSKSGHSSTGDTKPSVQRQARVKSEPPGGTTDQVPCSTKSVDDATLSKTEADVVRTAAKLRIQKNAARASFFSSLTTPPTSPQEEKRSPTSAPTAVTMDYTVHISTVKMTNTGETQYTVNNSVSSTNRASNTVTVSSSQTKPTTLPMSSSAKKPLVSSDSKSATPSPTSPNFAVMQGQKGSSIPRVSAQRVAPGSAMGKNVKSSDSSSKSSSSQKTEPSLSSAPSSSKSSPDKHFDRKASLDSADIRPKKVPPPPPPRKGSRLPNQTSVPTNGSALSPAIMESSNIQDSSVITGHMVSSAIMAGTLTSTPKTSAPVKPTTKFEKDLIGHKTVGAERKIAEQVKPVEQGAMGSVEGRLSFDVEMKREDRAGSSESTTSSSSVDSQTGVVVLKCKTTGGPVAGGKPAKKPKPPPPQRRSSLSSGPQKPEKPEKPEKPSKINGRSASVDDRLV